MYDEKPFLFPSHAKDLIDGVSSEEVIPWKISIILFSTFGLGSTHFQSYNV